MDIPSAVSEVTSSKEFKSWHAENPGYYLSSIFIGDGRQGEDWQVDFYEPSVDRIVSFSGSPLRRSEPQEVFKKEGIVHPLEINKVKTTLAEIRRAAKQHCAEKYSAERVNKTLIILQQLDLPVFNVTLVTAAFKIINLKFSAVSGELVKEAVHSILDLGKPHAP